MKTKTGNKPASGTKKNGEFNTGLNKAYRQQNCAAKASGIITEHELRNDPALEYNALRAYCSMTLPRQDLLQPPQPAAPLKPFDGLEHWQDAQCDTHGD